MKRLLILLLIITSAADAAAQHDEPFKVLFWNVENLFDTQHDEGKEDYDFTPEGVMHWTTTKLRRKIDDIARVIAIVGDTLPPDIVGLCEVENERVMEQLTRWSPLGRLGYRYVMTSSTDSRGIDVALLYQRERFRLISFHSITPIEGSRDILHVCGKILTGDTLDIIVAHLPSRRGGAKASEPRRMAVARRIGQLSDSICLERERPQLIIMGDFNDYPTNKSIAKSLAAKRPVSNAEANKLYHLFLAPQHRREGHGSYRHQGEWGFLDHIIVSGLMLRSDNNIHTSPEHSGEIRLPMLLTIDKSYGGEKPFRTHNGYSYIGGVSDHLPVYADFIQHLPF